MSLWSEAKWRRSILGSLDYRVFHEVLGIDVHLALRLEGFFRRDDQEADLREIEGVTDELLEKIRKWFVLSSDLELAYNSTICAAPHTRGRV